VTDEEEREYDRACVRDSGIFIISLVLNSTIEITLTSIFGKYRASSFI
jgi:hypothetical protein